MTAVARRPTFLTLDEVLALHADQVERYGGSIGVRDLGLLQSALAAPRATFGQEFLHGSLPEMAAAYLFHIARNHPFVDGNKRTSLAAAIAFLGLNGLWLEMDPEELGDVVLRVVEGAMTKAELAEAIRRHVGPLEV
ncbi:MAG TPA: type II toxin-antitoxin system death-on-curing family toxin [Anaeromyxobacteraceae bacterium]|nr:type II toxin-antitoxin system death-on-curing family toxin [Anaeromyxobacteraceae bacterium]